jgi:hypothetical protein
VSEPGVLTLELLEEALERVSRQPFYEEPLHLLRANKTWCDLCGPRALVGEKWWQLLHPGT